MKDQQNRRVVRHSNPSTIRETYVAKEEGPLIDQLQTKSDRSRSAAKKLLASGRVSVNGQSTTLPTQLLTVGDLITVHQAAPPKEFVHPLIFKVWENEDIVVVRKEAGIATVNTSHKDREHTVLWLLSAHYKATNPEAKLFMVSRLDKETAGFVILAKTIEAKERYVKKWRQIVLEQTFIAVVAGPLNEREQVLTAKSAPKKGVTPDSARDLKTQRLFSGRVKCLKSSEQGNLHVVEVIIGGERIFSLRKLLGDNNLVIAGDGRFHSEFKLKAKIALEQTKFVFHRPEDGKEMCFERTFPTHFFGYLKSDNEGIASTLTPTLGHKKNTRNNQ